MKVGNLVRYKGADRLCVTPWFGIIIGFDAEGDPVVRSNSGVISPQWTHNVEVIG